MQGVMAVLRECWVLESNLRMSCTDRNWTDKPTIYSIVIASIKVDEPFRRQGLCKRFIQELAADLRFDLVIVEGVGNPILAEALLRWGWDCDPVVMDFYKRKT